MFLSQSSLAHLLRRTAHRSTQAIHIENS